MTPGEFEKYFVPLIKIKIRRISPKIKGEYGWYIVYRDEIGGEIKATEKNELTKYMLEKCGGFPLECEIPFSLFITVFKRMTKRNRKFPLEFYYVYFAEKMGINLQGDAREELERLQKKESK